MDTKKKQVTILRCYSFKGVDGDYHLRVFPNEESSAIDIPDAKVARAFYKQCGYCTKNEKGNTYRKLPASAEEWAEDNLFEKVDRELVPAPQPEDAPETEMSTVSKELEKSMDDLEALMDEE